MNRIIVTGGAGFIGSAVARHIILDTPDAVCVVDKLTYAGNLENLAPIANDPRFKFEKVDICNKAELDRVFAEFKPTHVMHLAAESRSRCRRTLSYCVRMLCRAYSSLPASCPL